MENSLHLLLLFTVLFQSPEALVEVLDLGGNDWTAAGTKPPSTLVMFIPTATVPGCIHTDWYNHSKKGKEDDMYYRFNDVRFRTIAEHDWQYKKTFQVSKNVLNRKEQWLVCEGIDTAATLTLNGKELGRVSNMFLKHVFNVTGLLQEQFNQIIVSFQSAMSVANATRETLKYTIPPECPPDVQHGFCHVNLIRKEQCSFSWDWGPGFATQGIWKPIYIMALDEIIMNETSLTYDWGSQRLAVEASFLVIGGTGLHNGTLTVNIDELGIKRSFNVTILAQQPTHNRTFYISLPSNSVNYWWPNGQGEQNLYNITVYFQSQLKQDAARKTIWFGFRKVQLMQEPITGSNGLSFYFKINDRPIFVKGSNWIPADAFKNRLTRVNYTNLLQSAKDANMNMLRVWGGGIYESDVFYEIADRLGIMIWHDFMFACAMYPADKSFLSSVSMEVDETLWRLKSHPSIVIWAGNNENEAALGTDWYNTTSRFDQYKSDYVSLYVDTIGKHVSSRDSSRPYLSSSPTNGAESKTEGWVAKNPYDTHYGDVHYYNYNDDCLDWTKYPKTRFASEYGFQSWPSLETLRPVTVDEDLSWKSNFSEHRQHHGNGQQQMLDQILVHFKMPTSNIPAKKFEDLVYLSQIMQGLCYKSETEFYRRSRSEIVKGEGHTMGALYWQLNDIWQAPTWSSIEYGGKWKAVHYFAKEFYSSVALTAHDDDTTLTVYSVSDENAPIEPVTLTIEMRQWSSFDVISTWTQSIYIPPQASKMQYQNSTGTMLHYGGCNYKELCYFSIYLKELKDVPTTFFYPVPLKTIDGLSAAVIKVTSVKYQSKRGGVLEESYMFSLSLSTTAPAAFVWLEAIGIQGRFSENAFMFYERTKDVVFYALKNVTSAHLKNSITIKSLADIYIQTGKMKEGRLKQNRRIHTHSVRPRPSPRQLVDVGPEARPTVAFWLDGMQAQLAFGVCGVSFIMFFAMMLVCVVMRFNSPHLDKGPKVVVAPQLVAGRKGSKAAFPFLSEDGMAPILDTRGSSDEDEGGAFMIKMKHGYGHNARNVEFRFYVT